MKKTLIGALLAAVVISSPLAGNPAPPSKAGELLSRHRAALGGEAAIKNVSSMIISYEMEMVEMGMKGTMKTHTLMPCLTYGEISMGFLAMKQGYDGERIWMVDANGKLQYQKDPATLEEQVTRCLLTSYEYLSPGDDVTITVLEPDTVRGTYCVVLELVPEGGARCTISLDASNHLMKSLAIDARLGTIVQYYGDYRLVDGLMIPFEVLSHHVTRNIHIAAHIQSIEINVPIDPVLFLPPAESIDDYRFTSGCSAELIPFTFRNGHIYLPVRIGEVVGETMFLLDSGAGMTVIDSSMAAEMDLPLGGKVPGASAGGMTSFHLARFPGFGVAGIEFLEQTVLIFPVADLLRAFSDIEVRGVLGYDFLSRFVTRIDYENNRISFFEPDSFMAMEGEVAIDAPLLHSIFSFEGTIDGKYRGTFLLDTGANNSLLQKTFSVGDSPRADTCLMGLTIQGAGGSEDVDLCRFHSLEFGGVTIPDPVFVVPSGEGGMETFEGIDGVIGNDILERFTVTLDYRNQQVLLERNSLFEKSFYNDRSGLVLNRGMEGSVIVSIVIPGSPADEAGIMTGDEIVEIDGHKVSELGYLEDIQLLFRGPAGTVRTLVTVRGEHTETVTIVLRAYI